MIQSLYEASMYTFVFMWTPTLKNSWPSFQLPYGLIFSIYMVGIMIGSAIFGLLRFTSISVYSFAKLLIVVAAVSLFSPVATDAGSVVFSSFVLFEVCCGMYFPSVGVLRSEIIPESSRSTIMNFFRIPLNLLVAVVLVKVSSHPPVFCFLAIAHFLKPERVSSQFAGNEHADLLGFWCLLSVACSCFLPSNNTLVQLSL